MTDRELDEVSQSLLNKNSCGIDGISQKVLKTILPDIRNTLIKLINDSIKESKYPSGLKTAKIIPLFKNGDRSLCNNYRPVSLLSAFNKIFEKKLHKDINDFIKENNLLLFINQFGFRKFHSTIDALIKTYDYIISERRKNNKVIGIFLDLKRLLTA